MNKTYYFMAGLPRSGSSLLSALLNQHPDIYSSPNSPVVGLMMALENQLSTDEMYSANPKLEQAKETIASPMYHYHSDIEKPVIIDKNRSWMNRPHYIEEYFNIEPKILCPVRDIDEIFASFLDIVHRNPTISEDGTMNFIDQMLLRQGLKHTDQNRCMIMGDIEMGILGQSYEAMKQMIDNQQAHMIHFIEYNDLVNNTQETLDKVYKFLGVESFANTLSDVKSNEVLNDSGSYGLADMHTIRSEIASRELNPKEILPEEVYKTVQNMEFWRSVIDRSEKTFAKKDHFSNFIGK